MCSLNYLQMNINYHINDTFSRLMKKPINTMLLLIREVEFVICVCQSKDPKSETLKGRMLND